MPTPNPPKVPKAPPAPDVGPIQTVAGPIDPAKLDKLPEGFLGFPPGDLEERLERLRKLWQRATVEEVRAALCAVEAVSSPGQRLVVVFEPFQRVDRVKTATGSILEQLVNVDRAVVCRSCGWGSVGTDVKHLCQPSGRKRRWSEALASKLTKAERLSPRYGLLLTRDAEGGYRLEEVLFSIESPGTNPVLAGRHELTEGPEGWRAIEGRILDEATERLSL